MAGSVALSQALSYARDLRSLYETSRARERELEQTQERLRNAYQQSLEYAIDLRKTYRRLQQAIFQSLLGLANALEAKDLYTRGHSERVAALARRIALQAGVPRAGAEIIAHAGRLHDLGKIAVPESVLRKPGALSAEEWAVLRQHPVIGAQIVAPLDFFADGAVIVRHHHERHDGSGYPDGLRGELIPLGARIVAVADIYDALTSDRPYRGRLPRCASS
jgi:HD-GYP domain-containing protein (c-di-GMP phosphodiesterase class II)